MSNLTLTPPRLPEPDFTKTDALATYGVGFGRSIYGWNQNFIDLPIVNTSGHPESVRVLCHRLLGCWPVYRVGAVRVASRGLARL
jgi:hypothetical protein